jgi:hypothetical protein
MQYGTFCKVATCKIAISTLSWVSQIRSLLLWWYSLSLLYHKVAVRKTDIEAIERCCCVSIFGASGESEGELSLELRPA